MVFPNNSLVFVFNHWCSSGLESEFTQKTKHCFHTVTIPLLDPYAIKSTRRDVCCTEMLNSDYQDEVGRQDCVWNTEDPQVNCSTPS